MQVGRTLAHRLALVAFLLSIALGGFAPQNRIRAQGTNLLQNPGFEGTYVPFNSDTTRNLAPGWTPWNLPPASGDPSYTNATPEYRAATDASRVHGGSSAQEYFTFYATHIGGIYQQVSVAQGSQIRFSAFVYVWSTNGDDQSRSENPGIVKVQVGIDPLGGTDGNASGIVWSSTQEYYDQYRQLTVNGTALAKTVTVFVRSAPQQPVKNNHIYVDDAALIITAAAPTATLPPSATPLPSATHLPSITPTGVPSLIPTNTATATTTLIPTLTSVPTLIPSATLTQVSALFPSPTREGTIPATETPGGPTDTPLPPPNTPLPTETPGGPTDTATAFIVVTPINTAVPTIASLPNQITYTVQSGDTVYDLAIRFNSTTDAIISANGLNTDGLIFVAQQLVIPVPALPPTLAPFPTSTPFSAPAVPTYGLTGPTVNGIGTYIVQPGDDLFRVAQLYNISPEALARLNGIVNVSQVKVGQVLVVPGAGNNLNGQPPPTPIPARRVTYLVKPGDNLYRISIQYHVTLDALMRANAINNPNTIYVGETLYIP